MSQRLGPSGTVERPVSKVRRRVSKVVVPMKVPAPVFRLPIRRGSVEFCLGTEADHEAVGVRRSAHLEGTIRLALTVSEAWPAANVGLIHLNLV